MNRNTALCAASTLALVLGMGLASTAAAQAASPEAEVEAVVVTGSRIARKDYVAESPIVTVGQAAIEKSGTPALEETLNRLPQFSGSSTGQSTAASQRGGRANLNLRGLGIARTLVLLDGRRLQPSDPLGAIDLNTISSTLIEDVEVITGGASAVYGSDAVAGVVNFKLKRNFEGLQLDANYGITQHGDGQNTSATITWGTNLAEGRGNIAAALTYFDRGEVRREDRKFFDDILGTSVPATGTYTADATNLPTQAAVNALFNGRYGAPETVNRNGLYSNNPDGTIYEQRSGANFRFPADSLYYRGPTGAVFVRTHPQTLQQPLTRYSAFAKGDYEVNDHITAYGQAAYTHYRVSQVNNGVLMATSTPVYVAVNNASVPADIRTLLASRPRPNDPFLYYSTSARFGPSGQEQTYDVGQVIGGIRGDLSFRDWTYDVSASYGKTEEREDLFGYIGLAAFQSLLSAADAGASICQGGYPVFSFAPISDACKTYLQRDVRNDFTFDQKTFEASLQGGLFELPAGEVRFAAGVAYRRNFYEALPDAQLTAKSVVGTGGVDPSRGSTEVREAFVEALIPVLKDLPLIQSLNLDLAYRRSDYDSIGGVNTYKASAEWQVVPSLLLRGGYQRAIRAPSVGELFQARRYFAANIGSVATGAGDPCNITTSYRRGANAAQVRALCLATGVPSSLIDSYNFIGTAVLAAQVGNPNLSEETANSYTGGVVWRPRFDLPALSRLQVSVDYFDIDIRNAIGSITTIVSLQRCFNGDGGSNPTYSATNYFCSLISRDTAGTPNQSLEPTANLARYSTSGFDAQLDWRLEAGDFGWNPDLGALAINAVVSHVSSYKIQNLSTSPLLDYNGTIGNSQIDAETLSHPKWKATTTLTYEVGPAQVAFGWRYIDGMKNALNVGAVTPTAKGIHTASYFDLNGRWTFDEKTVVRAGIVNLFDKYPPMWTGQGAVDPSTYDLLGRRVFVGLTRKF